MSLHGESPLSDTEGEEIQAIAYETFSEVSASCGSVQRNPNHRDKTNDDDGVTEVQPREKSARGFAKKADFVDKINDDVATTSSTSSNNDICRICHMGNSRSTQSFLGEHGNRDANPNAGSRTSSCNLNLGLLVSACRCRGTVGLVHTKCLERWLTESGHTRCELCGYRYATIRVPRHGILRSILIWIKTFVATRQMLLDSLYLVVTTPLAVFSAYVCARTLKMALENRIGDIPWTIVAMLPTCSLTLVAYWGWLLTLQRLHGRRWRQYWQSNFIVQLVPDSPILANQSSEDLDFQQEDVYEDLPDIFNMI
ncbi:E3 ubiquitin-protein ligase MARCH3-like [Nasonia vitripennis]|uniref:RING-CH-type domain-containing protein n=1 Tax=Nasonia vitripennis TaxID=7425 RepID=A0A7M7GDQ5_NASVI|nr:E3 ubiquitin-protein ligase MARCH3-like [Nasonia vitripennis]